MTPKLPRYANRCDANHVRDCDAGHVADMSKSTPGPGTEVDPSRTVPEAVLTNGLAAIAGRDTSGGAAGSIAIWLLRVGQPKGADGVGQQGRCERYARARCFGDPPGRSTWVGCTMPI